MSKILKYSEFINEKLNSLNKDINEIDGSYSYGCAMVYFDYPEWNKITGLIDPNDLAEDGIENSLHLTLLYGIHNDIDHSEVAAMLKSFPNISVVLENMTLFENDKYDVVKFEIKNDLLSYLNEQLKQFPYTNEYTTFSPHCTIGYVKSGMGKKYIGKIKPIKLTSTYFIYSLANGEKIRIDI